ncbi:galactose oxidase [Saitoella complicata NRRL Y-17804]|uniref:galactose oxidase n=1 Tax=Saitoella complicata (strain BCRC 22490 / CBS 7301 / JCM 7358 / NBRC 10748 / NRRL Y-17804) TaxID=698492 RepID=UPI000866DE8E|nr:galactose oxidase [Saitoella complicata NRRL Y-17804]ODQ52839.1 galactose oxidase [Saitoella complicata NRRL Y-17804]
MTGITATWRKVASSEILKRSSQIVSVIGDKALIFGGELKPREPRDNDVHVVSLGKCISLLSRTTSAQAPSPRVGSASAVIQEKIYLFSGRGGLAMAPIEETGSVWEFDSTSSAWSQIKPDEDSAYPAARSYHCMASDGVDTLFVHAGCPETGRLSDLWAFEVSSRKWIQLASAPEPPRGGTSIAFANGLLYRMNGFDGKTELGGNLDVYDCKSNTWSSVTFPADDISGPSPRSVSALVALNIRSRSSIITLFGERDPSSLGHQGAGKMAGDVWAYDIESRKWREVNFTEGHEPAARGWFAADVLKSLKGDGLVVHGGLGENNERLDDIWVLEF